MVAWLMAAGSCVASALDAGRPSGMVAKRKPGRPATAAAPRDRTRRQWLYSVLTKVTWKPLAWRIVASFSIGVMWPCAGNGRHTAWGFSPVAAPVAAALISACAWEQGRGPNCLRLTFLFRQTRQGKTEKVVASARTF